MIGPLDNLVRSLARLPGLGRRSAERAALALVRRPEHLLDELSAALAAARERVRCCDVCGGFTTTDVNPCPLCTGSGRDPEILCVVEEPGDILAIERSGGFRGRYHALLGKLSPARMTGPAELRIQALLDRVQTGGVREVVLALSTDLDGDTTAGYLAERLRARGVRVTRLAFGLPADSGVGYSDPLTLKRALGGRQEVA
ncbi:MAG: recombination protein RecR [Lentisphaerae bacterium]|nr:recombination protein RecR [Lentisphaerota bacterium]